VVKLCLSADAASDWTFRRGNRNGGDSTLSRLASENNFDKFRSTLSDALKLVFLMTVPAACGLIVLGEPIIRLIYERGQFDSIDTNMTAWALAAYSIGLAGYAAIKIVSPAFYALDDAKTPMYVSIASISFTRLSAIR
jgi:putative peptidoglycan lipid II flippase